METVPTSNDLSWLSKIRLALALAIGVALVGLLPWERIQPTDNGVFAFLSGSISLSDLILCGTLSLAAGFVASSICTPLGMQMGVLAVPAGMTFWSFKSDAISTLFQAAPAASSRMAVYNSLRYEGFIWLALAMLGVIGAYAADKLFRRNSLDLPDKFDAMVKLQPIARIVVTVIGTVIVATYLLNFLATDISYHDQKAGFVVGQPANLQIAFGVIIAFMACGFCGKLFLGANYIWSAIATALVTAFSITTYAKAATFEYMAGSWSAAFFSKSVLGILPVQMVAFGFIGAVWGYWLAVRYHIWRVEQS
jgi:hypothetical protein